MSGPDQSPQPARTPEEALAAIRALCDSTSWILSAKDVLPILDSVQPAARTPEREAVERALNDVSKTLSRGHVGDDVWDAFERIRTRLWSELDSRVQPAPQQTVNRVRLRNYLWGLIGEEPAPQVIEDVIGYLRPVEGVVLTRAEAAVALRLAERAYESAAFLETEDTYRALATRLETAS